MEEIWGSAHLFMHEKAKQKISGKSITAKESRIDLIYTEGRGGRKMESNTIS